MNIYPAIDLKSGNCVRLFQGRFDEVTVYENDPVSLAKSFISQGAETLHIIDLDGAQQGHSVNLDIILQIKQSLNVSVQTGGGIRTKQQAENILNNGIDRIILGSKAISQSKQVQEWINEFGPDRIVLALDVRMDEKKNPKLALNGWQTQIEANLWEAIEEYEEASIRHVLCTDIGRDGTLAGPNILLYEECIKRYPSILFQASGGIRDLNDLSTLSALSVSSAIVGKALYENKIRLNEAISEVTKC